MNGSMLGQTLLQVVNPTQQLIPCGPGKSPRSAIPTVNPSQWCATSNKGLATIREHIQPTQRTRPESLVQRIKETAPPGHTEHLIHKDKSRRHNKSSTRLQKKTQKKKKQRGNKMRKTKKHTSNETGENSRKNSKWNGSKQPTRDRL